ncbi:hypothetical protein MMC13_003426 [Lambiella insularis]|nr:hypothetical protein [Lambiella insularis]
MATPSPAYSAFSSPLSNLPFGFEIKVGWASATGTKLRDDCFEALGNFPSANRMQTMEFKLPRIYLEGDCAIGVFVSKRDPSGTTVVKDNWRDIRAWAEGAITLNTGKGPYGWYVNMISGVQICFWEPKVVDPWHMCSLPKSYKINPWCTIATCLEILYTGPTSLPERLHGTPVASSLIPPPTAIPLGDVQFEVRRSVRDWVGPSFKRPDCLKVVESMERTFQMTFTDRQLMKYPSLYNSGTCTIGLFFTHPPESGEGRDIELDDMNIQAEALHLLTVTVIPHNCGGFVDFPNGMQLVVYEKEFVDPSNVCLLISRISLRSCLENMVNYKRLQRGGASSSGG